jgi:hypothetical protein
MTLLISYLESYFSDLQWWLSEWRITINVSKSSMMIFEHAVQCFIQSQSVTLFGEPNQWVNTSRYFGVTLDKRLTWSPHINQFRRVLLSDGLAGYPSEQVEQTLHLERSPTIQAVHPPRNGLYMPPLGGPLPAPTFRGCRCYNRSVFALLTVPLGT